MNRKLRPLTALLLGAGLLGCADLSTNVFRFEQTTAEAAHSSMQGYAQWWKSQTNGASAPALAELTQEREAVMAASRSLGQSLQILEGWRVVYTTNAASRPQLESAWAGVSAQSSNILWLVNTFRTKPRFPSVVPIYVIITNPPAINQTNR